MAKAATPDATPTYADVLSNHPNQSVKELWSKITALATPLEEIQATVKASSPPPVSELDAKLATSEDPEVTEYRKAIEKLETQLRQAREDAHTHLLKGYKTLSDDELKELKTKFAQQYEQAKTMYGVLFQYAAGMADMPGINVDGVLDALKEYKLPTLRAVGPTTGSANFSEGAPRPKVEKVVCTRGNGDTKEFDKLSQACVWAKLETAKAYAAWIAAAGVSTWQEVTETHEITVDNATLVIHPVKTS